MIEADTRTTLAARVAEEIRKPIVYRVFAGEFDDDRDFWDEGCVISVAAEEAFRRGVAIAAGEVGDRAELLERHGHAKFAEVLRATAETLLTLPDALEPQSMRATSCLPSSCKTSTHEPS